MAEKRGTALKSIACFPETVVQKLATLWITTAEELVGASTREDGPLGLAEYVGIPEDDVIKLAEQAVVVLPPGISFAPRDIFKHGLGALDEPEAGERPAAAAPFAVVALPPDASLRDPMPPVRQQGNPGTCVAHACVAAREFLLGEKSKEGDLPEQFL